ncbi:type II toxin-antitoxin system Phd/YefM family antitoxin [Microbacterium sp. P06]|uniref:type II toxin-antitoxin system Phd/YefM family antitoxin n=1 Tax=Microbacterium sp. P06 TaxID=3366949 RepID=UPI003745F98B
MESVSHREMRNQSAEVLRRVSAGESLIVTNSGTPVAILSPTADDAIDALVARGAARRATRGVEGLRAIERRQASATTSALMEDSRGRW